VGEGGDDPLGLAGSRMIGQCLITAGITRRIGRLKRALVGTVRGLFSVGVGESWQSDVNGCAQPGLFII